MILFYYNEDVKNEHSNNSVYAIGNSLLKKKQLRFKINKNPILLIISIYKD
jgi:hypothetical protein